MKIVSKILFKFKSLDFIKATLLAIALLISDVALAQEAPILGGVQDLIAGYGTAKNAQKALKAIPYNFNGSNSKIPLLSLTHSIEGPAIEKNTNTLTNNAIALTLQPNNRLLNQLTSLPGSDYSPPCRAIGGGTCPSIDDNVAFNINTLIGPVAYTQNYLMPDPKNPFSGKNVPQSDLALDYISLLTGLAQSIAVPSQADIAKAIKDPKQASSTRSFLLGIRSYSAALSVALSNFYHAVMTRVQNINLPSGQTIPNINGKRTNKVSYLQLQDYLANWRSRDSNWVKAVNAASPATLQRQLVFMTAQELSQMQTLSRQIERLNVTMSTVLATTLAQMKSMPPLAGTSVTQEATSS